MMFAITVIIYLRVHTGVLLKMIDLLPGSVIKSIRIDDVQYLSRNGLCKYKISTVKRLLIQYDTDCVLIPRVQNPVNICMYVHIFNEYLLC